MKNCPFCAEEILDAAIKCKHCGEMLTAAGAVPLAPVTAAESPKPLASSPSAAIPIKPSGTSPVIVFGVLFAACGAAFLLVMDPPSFLKSAPSAAGQLPWIAEVHANCDRYKAAPNEIKKSAIYSENTAMIRSTKVAGARGKLTQSTTTQGGDRLSIAVTVGDVEFKNSILDGVRKGSPIYEAASTMTEGHCVVFSAEDLAPASVLEQSKVCDAEYYVTFTALAPCQ